MKKELVARGYVQHADLNARSQPHHYALTEHGIAALADEVALEAALLDSVERYVQADLETPVAAEAEPMEAFPPADGVDVFAS